MVFGEKLKGVIKGTNRKGLLVLLLFFTISLAQGQSPYKSRLGRFQVDQKKGCAPFKVTIINADVNGNGDCTPGKPCLMDFEGKVPPVQQQNVFTFTYNTPGTYKLSIIYQSIGADDIIITVDQDIQPAFDLYTCAGSKVSLNITDNNYDGYIIDFNNDNNPEVPLTATKTASFTYLSPGIYTVSVRGQDVNTDPKTCSARVKNFNAIATLPATTINTLTAIDASSIKLDFTPVPNVLHKMEIATNNSSTFQLLQNVYGISTITATGLKTDDNYYCFRLSSYDPCTGTNIYSNTICSQNFDLTLLNGSNKLDWVTSSGGIINMRIKRDNNNNYTTIPGAPLTFNDVDVVCGTTYCYQVISNYSGGTTSISLEKCGTTFKTITPTAIDNTSSVVNSAGTVADLTWLQDPAFKASQYNIFKSYTNPFSQVAVTTTTKYTDQLYSTEGNYCYRINYEDECKNKSLEGALICPMRLTGYLDVKNVITLNWNSYVGWKAGVKNYTIEKYNVNGSLIKTFTTTDTTFVDDQADPSNQVARYAVKANAMTTGLITSTSNLVSFTKEANLYAPTAFTPNGDGLNDTFSVTGQFIVKMELSVFDRWGGLVYSTVKNEPWNGTKEGRPMTDGAYVWKVNITDLAGRTFSDSGTVGLMQKGM